MKINKKDILTWVEALWSGNYHQTGGTLQDTGGDYCCYGVACELFIPKNKQKRDYKGFLIGEMPSDQNHAPRWLKVLDVDFLKKIRNFESEHGSDIMGLADLNDDDYTFDEIADIIYAVYILKVLD